MFMINGERLPDPSSFLINPIKLSRSDRLASGKLVRDIIAIKMEFTLTYDMVKGDEFDQLLELYLQESEFNFAYVQNGKQKNAFVHFAEFPVELAALDPEYWTNISMKLEEV